MGETTPQIDYYVRAGRPAAVQTPSPPAPVAAAETSTGGLLRELGGRVTWRGSLRFFRLARILIPLAVAALGAVWRIGAHALESVPFVNSSPAHHVGANGRLDPIDPESLFVKSALLKYAPAQVDANLSFADGDRSLAEDLTGTTAGRGILVNPSDPNSMWATVTSIGVWSDAMRDSSFRDRALTAIGEDVGDEPETISVGGKEAYLFHIEKYPTGAHGPDFVVFFYEDQIVQISGPDERHAQMYANDVTSALP